MDFQELIFSLQRFWADQGCVIQQPYDIEVGAGTFNPATFLRVLGPEPWKVAYVEPSRRPPMADTERIPIASSTIINIRSSSNPLPSIFRRSISRA